MMPGLRKKAMKLFIFISNSVKSASVGWPSSKRGGSAKNDAFGLGTNPFAKPETKAPKGKAASGQTTRAKANLDEGTAVGKDDDFDELFPMQTT